MQETYTPLPSESHRPKAVRQSATHLWRSMLESSRLKLAASIVALILILIALVVIGQTIPLDKIWGDIRQAQTEWVLVTVLLVSTSQVLRIVRFKRLLEWDEPVATWTVSQATMGGQVINWLSPIRLGDVWRVWRVSQNRSRSLLWTASVIAIEKSADSLVLMAFAAYVVLSPLPPGFPIPVVRLFATVMAGVLFVSALSAVHSTRLRDRLLKRIPRVEALIKATSTRTLWPENMAVRRNKRRWLELLACSASIWLVAILTNAALANAFNIHVSLVSQVVLLLALQTSTVFSPVPGNVGIFPLVSLGVLSAAGVDSVQAMAYGSVLYAVAYGVNLTLAIVAYVAPTIYAKAHELRPRNAAQG